MSDPSSQSPRDRILWILAAHAGKMERSRLRRCMGVEYALLNPILEELVREGRIRIAAGKKWGFDITNGAIDRRKMAGTNIPRIKMIIKSSLGSLLKPLVG